LSTFSVAGSMSAIGPSQVARIRQPLKVETYDTTKNIWNYNSSNFNTSC